MSNELEKVIEEADKEWCKRGSCGGKDYYKYLAQAVGNAGYIKKPKKPLLMICNCDRVGQPKCGIHGYNSKNVIREYK